eukprot:215681_1
MRMDVSLFVLWVLFLLKQIICVTSSNNHNDDNGNGYFSVIINPYLSFILCSTTKEENKNSELKLININDVFHNSFCAKSSQFNLLSSDLFFDSEINTITKINKNTKKKKTPKNKKISNTKI